MKVQILLLILMPWCAAWFGLYCLHNLMATFVLYHAVCLLPAIVLKRKLWLGDFTRPNAKQLAILGAATAVSSAVAAAIYFASGDAIISRQIVLNSLAQRGFHPNWFIPLATYFLTVNPLCEELFWRGVIYHELRGNDRETTNERHFSGEAIGAIAFAAWHYVPLSTMMTLPWNLIALAVIAIAGYLMARLYEQSGSLMLPILWHAAVMDFPIMLLLFLMLGTFA